MRAAGKITYLYGARWLRIELSRFVPPWKSRKVSVFQHHCTACDRTELIFPSMLRSLANTDHGIELRFECWCGAEQSVLSGRNAQEKSREQSAGVAA
jgi:hypothetical protein